MSMANKKFPPVKIEISKETYNELLSYLEILTADENGLGDMAANIFQKITKYACIIKYKDEGEFAFICLYERETEDLIQLLLLQLLGAADEQKDYFSELKKRRGKE
ncbi:hypothetical protein AGMMS49975_29840 [Clostridia bacterium]|nr:hypothetical protein AGMMS49975_29840 [Clostridia bacterium]